VSARAAGRGGPATAASNDPAPPDTEAELIGVTVQGCSSVAALSGQFRSYLPGRIIHGVRADADGVEVHIVARYGKPMTDIAAEIQGALQPLLHGRPLTVGIDDIVLTDVVHVVDEIGNASDAAAGPAAAERSSAS
jgi:hypothetical protein